MSKRAMGEPRSNARPLMSKWARQEVEELVEEVFDGWMFDGPWTTEEYYRFRAALENAVLEAAPRIAFASERTQDRGRHTGAEPLLCPFCGGDGEERTWDDRLPDGTPFIRHAIKCRDCGASTRWVSTGADALRAWALRAAPQPGGGALREAEGLLRAMASGRAHDDREHLCWCPIARDRKASGHTPWCLEARRWLASRTGAVERERNDLVDMDDVLEGRHG